MKSNRFSKAALILGYSLATVSLLSFVIIGSIYIIRAQTGSCATAVKQADQIINHNSPSPELRDNFAENRDICLKSASNM